MFLAQLMSCKLKLSRCPASVHPSLPSNHMSSLTLTKFSRSQLPFIFWILHIWTAAHILHKQVISFECIFCLPLFDSYMWSLDTFLLDFIGQSSLFQYIPMGTQFAYHWIAFDNKILFDRSDVCHYQDLCTIWANISILSQ